MLSRLILTVFLVLTQNPSQLPMQQNPANQKGTRLSDARSSFPSKEELSDLLSKADEKVSSYESAIKTAKTQLDKLNTDYARTYLEAATVAHDLISKTVKNGPSAYQLVAILVTLDDLTVNATRASLYLTAAYNADAIQGKPPNPQLLASLSSLTAVATASNDIAELLSHATLRFIDAEEKLIDAILPKDK